MGWPVKHSLSPPMQEAAFAACGIAAEYRLLPTPAELVKKVVRDLPARGFDGWNVTVPHKNAVGRCMDRLDHEAMPLASVNTVVVEKDRRLTGYSTDGYGLEMALLEQLGFAPAGQRMAFVGGGGAVAATAVHMARKGVAELVMINRTLAKIEKIANLIANIAPQCRVHCLSLDQTDRIGECLSQMPLLVQGTSLGLGADDPMPLNPDMIAPDTAVMDMIYGPTPFLQALRKRGLRTADGQAMLLHQGARSFFLWTGLDPPLEVMREALSLALQKQPKTSGQGR